MSKLHPTEITTIKSFLALVGEMTQFSTRFFRKAFTRPFEIEEIIRQVFVLGYKALFLIGITVFIIGLVITIQLAPRMEQLGAISLVPNMMAISLIREVGPVLTALVCAGKIGSGISAEIGAMKVTQQIDAMSVSGADDYKYLVVTRIAAVTFTLPILTIYSFIVGLIGSYFAYNLERDMSLELFLNTAFYRMDGYDVVPSIIKSILFGFFIGSISCYFGYKTGKGAAGVGHACNTSIVYSFLSIFFIDMMAAQITHLLTK